LKITDPLILRTPVTLHGDVKETTKYIGVFVTSTSVILPFIFVRGVSHAS